MTQTLPNAYLHFADGTVFKGKLHLKMQDPSVQKKLWAELEGGGILGESAFTTSMSGFAETVTDPSYLGQHIIFAYPHLGNYLVDEDTLQSAKCHATSLICRHLSENPFWDKVNVPILTDVDTRALIRFLTRNPGHASVITLNSKTPGSEAFNPKKLICSDLSLVAKHPPQWIIPGDNPVVLIDYGIKEGIVRFLKEMNLPLVCLGYNATSQEVMALKPRLIFLSNGPGDPRDFMTQIQTVKELLSSGVPLRGICLGHQLLGLALGAKILKLPFGQRGINHPVFHHPTGQVLITSQNHGYAIDPVTFEKVQRSNPTGKHFFIEYTSLFDGSIEGIASTDHQYKSVQFHPEGNPGPHDAQVFFREVESFMKSQERAAPIIETQLQKVPNLKDGAFKRVPFKKIMVIGSGPIKIGQASEFDYSGSQACRVLKEQGLEVVLVNSNPATIMTDTELSHRTYIEPLTPASVKSIIRKEKVDAIISTMGGQTALNLCLSLQEDGFLKEAGVTLLGANSDTIRKTEDRTLFAEICASLNIKTGLRVSVQNADEAVQMAKSKVHFPLIIRRDFALGGQGAALIFSEDALKEYMTSDLKFPIVLEKSLHGFKEIELEVMVDREQNAVVICSIENVDPCGVHTGDSITVAPAQTISDRCMQNLRTMALSIAKVVGVVAGGANVQFAIHPHNEEEIYVIEMNPRVSRSSALASKATGYPIAKISALLAIGFTLKEILNDITKASPVAFEPTLDYVAVKIPIFPFQKFPASTKILGPQMRSVGEVLALGENFLEATMKALRSLELGLEIPKLGQLKEMPITPSNDFLVDRLKNYHAFSILTVLEGLRQGFSQEFIFELTKISPWFIAQMDKFAQMEKDLQKLSKADKDVLFQDVTLLREYKNSGFSDKYLAALTNHPERSYLEFRIKEQLFPIYKAVDTCSGEFFAETPYYYSTYQKITEPTPLNLKLPSYVILGSGPNRIGQGIEFDYSCVKASKTIRERGFSSILVNSNPETVSTDYDSSDRLFLAPLYAEDLFDIFHFERPAGIIASFSGQTGIKIREDFENTFRKEYYQAPFLGASMRTLELTEDRKLFRELLDQVDVAKTKTKEIKGFHALMDAITEIGLPVIIRPSFVIGGESMYIFHTMDDLGQLPPAIKGELESFHQTFLVETYLENAVEYDLDLIRDNYGNCMHSLCEHIEHAGVHSGDSGMMTPAIQMNSDLQDKMVQIACDLANILKIVGPINFQFALKGEDIYCIEANPRGSRTLPFLSKAMSLPLPSMATLAMLGDNLTDFCAPPLKARDQKLKYYCVKQSTFPFDRFPKDDIILGPKMLSTGETMGVDANYHKALLKSYLGNYPKILGPGKILFSLSDTTKNLLLPFLKKFHEIGMEFAATPGTCSFIRAQGLPCEEVSKLKKDNDSLLRLLKHENMKIVFNTPNDQSKSRSDGEVIRNFSIQNGVPCFTNPENIKAVSEALTKEGGAILHPVALQDLSLLETL